MISCRRREILTKRGKCYSYRNGDIGNSYYHKTFIYNALLRNWLSGRYLPPAIGHRWTYRKIIRTSLDSDRNTLARAFWLFHANRNVSSICCSSEITHYRNHSNTRNDSKIQYVNTNNRCRRHNLFYQ